MARISTVNFETAHPDSRKLLETAKQTFGGSVPNTLKTLGHAPGALQGFFGLAGAAGKSSLTAAQRHAVALSVSQYNGCEYCLAAHTVFGGKAGLKPEEIRWAREARNLPVAVLARKIVETRGHVSDADLSAARAAGLTDQNILDVVLAVTDITLTNFTNNLAKPEVDFPKVSVEL